MLIMSKKDLLDKVDINLLVEKQKIEKLYSLKVYLIVFVLIIFYTWVFLYNIWQSSATNQIILTAKNKVNKCWLLLVPTQIHQHILDFCSPSPTIKG